MSGADRRKHPRHAVDIPVSWTANGLTYPGQLKDICRDAALVETHRLCAMDSKVVLTMNLNDSDGPLDVAGRVIRLAPGEGDIHGMAILFTDANPAAATRIDFFIAGLD